MIRNTVIASSNSSNNVTNATTNTFQSVQLLLVTCSGGSSDTVRTTPTYIHRPAAPKAYTRSIFSSVRVRPRAVTASVGAATRYGLEDPGLKSPFGPHFPHPSRPDLRPTQPPIQWVLGISPGKSGRGVALTHPHLAPRLKEEDSYTSTPLWAFAACSIVNFTFTFTCESLVLPVAIQRIPVTCIVARCWG